MIRNLCIGIQNPSGAWKAILEQTGVWFEKVNYQKNLKLSYSCIILNEPPSDPQKQKLGRYLNEGGSVLETAGVFTFITEKSVSPSRVKTIVNESRDPAFSHLPMLDIYNKVWPHSNSPLFKGIIALEEVNNGFLGYLGLDLPALLTDSHYKRRRFFNPTGEHPDEIVSQVSKHEICELFTALLKELVFRRGLPYISKWHSPGPDPVFCFRIDSDYGDRESIDRVYNLARKHQMKLTWFLHIQAHENWLDHLNSFANQELALHAYRHGTSGHYEKTRENIETGLQKMKKAGMEPDGFCAPYGIWNQALQQCMKEYSFDYSSEFTFAYDGLPVSPGNHLPLQIPIHPICTGSLNRKQAGVNQMAAYFGHILRNKKSRHEPACMYHHPLQPGLEAIDKLFSDVRKSNYHNLTFGEYAAFWNRRNRSFFRAILKDETIIFDQPVENLYFQVCRDHKHFDLFSSETVDYSLSNTSEFEYSKPYLPSSEEIRKMRTNTFGLLKTNILDWKNRNRL